MLVSGRSCVVNLAWIMDALKVKCLRVNPFWWFEDSTVAFCGQNEQAVFDHVPNLVNSRAKVLTGYS